MTVATEPTTALLTRAFGRISRALRYRTRAAQTALGVTDSESELLRLLRRQPGIRVQDAASELAVASNSVSTLVKQLTRTGLIARSGDPSDARAVCLRLTSEAEEWLKQMGSTREEAVARAFDGLDEADQEAIEAATPALRRLADRLLQ
ncbi:MAG TPA: MarR family transcriptional regulator [Chloroflexota bacterium]|nr:MarR family transcriptional regulator [Chloroflexota bacterium]